jgi:Cu(I)/Ag(I) efflux system membrane fusion protein
MVTLATQVRSKRAEHEFTHFYCPMVPGGGGDWLQPDDQLLNPYFGSQMLRCGEKVQTLPAHSATDGDASDHHHSHDHVAAPAETPRGAE